ncbi:MAG: hypothetical protein O3B37_16075 [Proteobacteria bacterium]|nr:hypothetical protein [Pseudomonadota bacterium]
MLLKIGLTATFAVLALIAIWLDDSFILFGIVIAVTFFLYLLRWQGKLGSTKEVHPLPDDSDTPGDLP